MKQWGRVELRGQLLALVPDWAAVAVGMELRWNCTVHSMIRGKHKVAAAALAVGYSGHLHLTVEVLRRAAWRKAEHKEQQGVEVIRGAAVADGCSDSTRYW